MEKSISPNILKEIKQATSMHHDQIEKNTLTKAIIQNTITQDQYTLLLSKFYGFHKACEPLLSADNVWQGYQFNIEQRRKTLLIAKDLKFLGFNEAQIAQLKTCSKIPQLKTAAQKIGFLYVIEGSTLGGQVLGRQLKQSLGFEANQGASYFNSYGKENLRDMWMGFQNLMVDFTTQNLGKEEEIITSAQETFQKLDEWLAA
jgi:heme oxygenase